MAAVSLVVALESFYNFHFLNSFARYGQYARLDNVIFLFKLIRLKILFFILK